MRHTQGWSVGVLLVIALLAHDVLLTSSAHATARGSDSPSIEVGPPVDVGHSGTQYQLDESTRLREPRICAAAIAPCSSLVGMSTFRGSDHLLFDTQGSIGIECRQPNVTGFTFAPHVFTSSASTRRALLQVFLN